MAEAMKESPEAGGDPGASMVKRKLPLAQSTPKCGRVQNTRSALKKYIPRPLTHGKKAVSLDDLSRDYDDVSFISRRRAVGVSPACRSCAPRSLSRSSRCLRAASVAPAPSGAKGLQPPNGLRFAPAPRKDVRFAASGTAPPSPASPSAAAAACLLLKRRVINRPRSGTPSTEGSRAAPAVATGANLGKSEAAPAQAVPAPAAAPAPAPVSTIGDGPERPVTPGAFCGDVDDIKTMVSAERDDTMATYGYCDTESDTEDVEDEELRIHKAAKKVFSALLLNAWRRRRAAHRAVEASLAQASAHAGGLALQVRVLRQLLDAERARVAMAADEQRGAAARAERLQMLLDAHVQDRGNLEKHIADLQDNLSTLNTKFNNAQNDYLTARNDAKTYEEQLANEREKLAQIRVEKQALLDKMHLLESILNQKTAAVESLQGEVDSLLPLLAVREELEKTVEEVKKSAESLEAEAAPLREQLAQAKTQEAVVHAQVQSVQLQLSQLEARRTAMEAVVAEQQAEIDILRQQLQKYSWRQRCLQVARVLMNIPLSLIDILQPYPYTMFFVRPS